MIGYLLSVIRPHLHYADTLCGFEDAYFLLASHRKGLTGYRLLKVWKEAMVARGVDLLFAMTKPWLDNSRLFERLGFTLSDYTLSCWIGSD